MAEEAKKAPADKDKAGHKDEKGAKPGLFASTPFLLAIVMVVEAAVLFAGFKFLAGGPSTAAGASIEEAHASEGGQGDGHGDGHGAGGAAPAPTGVVEVPLVDFKPPNRKSGRLYLYQVVIVAQVKAEKKDALAAKVKQYESLIKDRIRMIVAQSDPEKLGGGSEPGLETLRRQIKYQLDEIVGDGMIEDVLVPQCTPIRVD